ncbi:hypothetical protein K438DRAFT_2031240 [Mycena galopus ATCC 62051]|nr:hypothetical protein K438DRAFT_2031240 [Mycena galopus ATCC 62051]
MAAGVIRDSLTRVAPFVKKSLTVTFAAGLHSSLRSYTLCTYSSNPSDIRGRRNDSM